MKLQLVAHASVIIDTADTSIWCDPWLFGTALNDSWELFPAPVWNEQWLKRIQFLWISHEHPDHFHIPTLESLPSTFKDRVTVLFQQNNSDKMFDAFRRLGFKRLLALPHRRRVGLSAATEIYCYQQGVMNSCLAVISGGKSVFNINDADLNRGDCRMIVRDIGPTDVVLNQFSIAIGPSTADFARELPAKARRVIDVMVSNHRSLKAGVTIPFASYIRFCCADNRYMNRFLNQPREVAEEFRRQRLQLAVVAPGDVYDTESPFDSEDALRRLEKAYRHFDDASFGQGAMVALDEIRATFFRMVDQLRERYPGFLLSHLKPITVRIPDLDKTVSISIRHRSFVESTAPADAVIGSAPLQFAFKYPFGFQTLFNSGRYRILRNTGAWNWMRAIGALNNAELYLRLRYLLKRRNIRYFRARWNGGFNQFVYQLQRMKRTPQSSSLPPLNSQLNSQ